MALPLTIRRHVDVIDPRFISGERWARETGWSLSSVGTIPVLQSEDNWRQWANTVVSLPALAAVGAPRADGFPSFAAWAVAFNQSMQLVQLSP